MLWIRRSRAASNNRRNSLIVNWIKVSGVGRAARLPAVTTTRKACASSTSTVQRCQEVQVPGLVLIQPGQPLAGLEALLDPPALPGHGDQLLEPHVGRVAPLDLLDRARNGVSGQYAKFA